MQLKKGEAEVFGTALVLGEKLSVSGQKLAVFTWEGCTLAVVGQAEIMCASWPDWRLGACPHLHCASQAFCVPWAWGPASNPASSPGARTQSFPLPTHTNNAPPGTFLTRRPCRPTSTSTTRWKPGARRTWRAIARGLESWCGGLKGGRLLAQRPYLGTGGSARMPAAAPPRQP